jgi:hypothetical protein
LSEHARECLNLFDGVAEEWKSEYGEDGEEGEEGEEGEHGSREEDRGPRTAAAG